VSGPIGSSSTPIQIANDTANPIELSLRTSGADAYVQSASGGNPVQR